MNKLIPLLSFLLFSFLLPLAALSQTAITGNGGGNGGSATAAPASPAPSLGNIGPLTLPTATPGGIDIFDGDSITAGVGSSSCSATFGSTVTPSGNCWADQVSVNDHAQELNMAVSGTCLEYTTISGSACNKSSTVNGSLIKRYATTAALIPTGARVYVQIGTNDVVMASNYQDSQVNVVAFRSNLVTVLSAYKTAVGSTGQVILGELPLSSDMNPQVLALYNTTIADIAVQYNYPLANNFASYVVCAAINPTDTTNCTNTLLHPDPNGQNIYAQTVEGANYQNAVAARDADRKVLGFLSSFTQSESQNLHNVKLGNTNLQSNTTGTGLTAIGNAALPAQTTGSYNTAVGFGSLLNSSTSTQNTALGAFSLASATTAVGNNTCQGFECLYFSNGTGNTAIGELAGSFVTGGASGNVSPVYGTYLGIGTEAYAPADSNETVIGSNAVGNGTNTITLGDNNVTGIYSTGGLFPTTAGNSNTYTSDFFYNKTQVTQDNSTALTSADNAHIYGLASILNFGGTNSDGEHDGILGSANLTSPHKTGGLDTDTVGVIGRCQYLVNDGGTTATPRGSCYGLNGVPIAQNGATNLFVVTGLENDVILAGTGSSALRFGADMVSSGTNQGFREDAAYAVLSGSSPAPSWQTGLLFSNGAGGAPVSSTGTLIGTDSASYTVKEGIDFSAYSFTSWELNFGNFQVDQLGDLNSSGGGAFSGNLSVGGNVTSNGAKLGVSSGNLLVDLTNGTQFLRNSSDGSAQINSQNNIIHLNGTVGFGPVANPGYLESASSALILAPSSNSQSIQITNATGTPGFTLNPSTLQSTISSLVVNGTTTLNGVLASNSSTYFNAQAILNNSGTATSGNQHYSPQTLAFNNSDWSGTAAVTNTSSLVTLDSGNPGITSWYFNPTSTSILLASGLNAGSSSYGSTSASVAGTLTVNSLKIGSLSGCLSASSGTVSGSGSACGSGGGGLPATQFVSASFNSVQLAATPATTLIGTSFATGGSASPSITLGTSTGPNGNWRVTYRLYATTQDTNTGSVLGRINFGIAPTAGGTSALRQYSHPQTNTANTNFSAAVLSDVSTLIAEGSTDGPQNSVATPEYSAIYTNGTIISGSIYAIPSTGINADTIYTSGWLEITAVPQ